MNSRKIKNEIESLPDFRKSEQYLMPVKTNGKQKANNKNFEIYPYFSLGPDKIHADLKGLGGWIQEQKIILLEGYVGVFWEDFRSELEKNLSGITRWIDVSEFLKSEETLSKKLDPFLGTENSVWGKRCNMELKDFFESVDFLNHVELDQYDQVVVYGVGASLCKDSHPVAYIDLPKNELQYRMRAGKANNLGFSRLDEPFVMYKHYYFIDWGILDNHKKDLMENIQVYVDGQRKGNYTWAFSTDVYKGLDEMLNEPIRVRPWFEPGAWGGQWLKNKIPGLNKKTVNYAWAFSLIVPENGILLESEGILLEISFDFLMFRNGKKVLGKHFERFGYEFPIRFNFLDTMNGGNLSVQCHPSKEYIKKEFGENFTQDETYYILDSKENAGVYLGFQEGIDKKEFRNVLERSQELEEKIDIEKYVQKLPSKKHDLFLIPNETVHSSGSGNMVLEISATPYIFTFKMYDWVRLDLEGKPRPINIDHAFKNLNFKRKGEVVEKELISKPYTRKNTSEYNLIHYPTHSEHFYDIERIDFEKEATFNSDGNFYVMMVVEGESVTIKSADKKTMVSYAETFVIPASMDQYTLINTGKKDVKIVRAFIKDPLTYLSDSTVN